MTWTGDIYEQVSGDYRIDTQYTISGEFCTIRFGFDIIGYSNSTEAAKAKCEQHAVGAT
jgi:hypothetical protein